MFGVPPVLGDDSQFSGSDASASISRIPNFEMQKSVLFNFECFFGGGPLVMIPYGLGAASSGVPDPTTQ